MPRRQIFSVNLRPRRPQPLGRLRRHLPTIRRHGNQAVVKDAARFGRRRLASRTKSSEQFIQSLQRQTVRGTSEVRLYIYEGPPAVRGRSNSGYGPFWEWLNYGTPSRVNYEGNIRGGWPPPGNPTGFIEPVDFIRFPDSAESRRIWREQIAADIQRVLKGGSPRRP